MLDCFYERDRAFEEVFERLTSFKPEIAADLFHNGIATCYHCQEEYDRLERALMRKFDADPDFIKKSYINYNKKTLEDIKELKKINKLDHKKLPNKELARLFKKSRTHFVFNSAYDIYCWVIEKFFIPVLQRYLEKRLKELGKKEKLPEYITLLVTPQKKSKVFVERVDLFNIVKEIRKDKRLKDHIKTKPRFSEFKTKYPKIYDKIKKHVEGYAYLPVLVNNPPTSEKDVWNDIVNFLKHDSIFKIESKRIGDVFDESTKEKTDKIIQELNPDEKTLKLIKGLRETAFVRTEDNVIMGKSSYLMMAFFNEIAKRLGIDYYKLKELTPDEVIEHLEKNKKVSKDLIKQRLELTASVANKGERYVFVGEKAREIKKIIEDQLKHEKHDKDVFVGTCASAGGVTGIVKLALSSKEAKDIKNGEILVAPATSADFVPAMRKAAAIITEFGGITSHAAVVSREFNVPCIVGVKNITKFLKSGDLVDVNANEAVIRKINPSQS